MTAYHCKCLFVNSSVSLIVASFFLVIFLKKNINASGSDIFLTVGLKKCVAKFEKTKYHYKVKKNERHHSV
jgi:hypothetical protein